MDTIENLHLKAKKALGSFYTPLFSFLALFLWTIFSKSLINTFYEGYLSYFGIEANYPISGTIMHSKLMLFFLADAIFALIGVGSYVIYHKFFKVLKSQHFIKKVIWIIIYWLILSFIICFSIGVFLIFINRSSNTFLIILASVNPKFLFIYAFISAYIMLAFYITNLIPSQKSKKKTKKIKQPKLNILNVLENKSKQKKCSFSSIVTIIVIVISIIVFDHFFPVLGKVQHHLK